MKILLLSSDQSIAMQLTNAGHLVAQMQDGTSAFTRACDEQFDLLVLDTDAKMIGGFEIARRLKELDLFAPTIFISDRTDIATIAQAFAIGCKDYIKKPFFAKELELRINSIMNDGKIKPEIHTILNRHYSFDKQKNELLYNGEMVKLTRKQIQIVKLLVKHSPSIVDFDMFREVVWLGEPIDNPTIRAEISRFNRSLKNGFIKNIRGVGYKIDKYKL